MALATSCALLLAVGSFAVIVSAAGHRILRLGGLEFPSDSEHLLCSAALGVLCLQVILFGAQIAGHLPVTVIATLVLAFVFGFPDVLAIGARAYGLVWRTMRGSRVEKWTITAIAVVLLVEGLAAMAPLTGSDALHYHFTAASQTLRYGFRPNFFLSHSFFTGQSHTLILAGLALGSDRLSMGLLFLGGVLAAAATACVAYRWMDRKTAGLVALVFLVTPVVFWQISAAGAPDLWMSFYTTIGVLVISRYREMPRMPLAVAAGALAGGVAGAKYTGCLVAASLAVAFLWEARSAARAVLFGLSALAVGVWPYARNLMWTGDPVFPFLLPYISPERVNAYTLASYLADTGASEHKEFWQLAAFPLFAAIDPAHLGFWQFLGPLVLAFAPLLIFTVRNTPLWRAVLVTWVGSAMLIGFTTGMTRFLLPVLPIALAAVAAGAAQLKVRRWLGSYYVATASVCGFLLFGTAGLLWYDRFALAAATGFSSREEYLRDHAPEYGEAEFINRRLQNEGTGKVLVFLRHGYYLSVAFLYGDPSASWAIDPSQYRNPAEWLELFHQQGVLWVVRSPEYPPAIARPLYALETHGKLVPVARGEVSDFAGMRIAGDRRKRMIEILKVIE
jgi:Protein of unknown function (DUF1420)